LGGQGRAVLGFVFFDHPAGFAPNQFFRDNGPSFCFFFPAGERAHRAGWCPWGGPRPVFNTGLGTPVPPGTAFLRGGGGGGGGGTGRPGREVLRIFRLLPLVWVYFKSLLDTGHSLNFLRGNCPGPPIGAPPFFGFWARGGPQGGKGGATRLFGVHLGSFEHPGGARGPGLWTLERGFPPGQGALAPPGAKRLGFSPQGWGGENFYFFESPGVFVVAGGRTRGDVHWKRGSWGPPRPGAVFGVFWLFLTKAKHRGRGPGPGGFDPFWAAGPDAWKKKKKNFSLGRVFPQGPGGGGGPPGYRRGGGGCGKRLTFVWGWGLCWGGQILPGGGGAPRGEGNPPSFRFFLPGARARGPGFGVGGRKKPGFFFVGPGFSVGGAGGGAFCDTVRFSFLGGGTGGGGPPKGRRGGAVARGGGPVAVLDIPFGRGARGKKDHRSPQPHGSSFRGSWLLRCPFRGFFLSKTQVHSRWLFWAAGRIGGDPVVSFFFFGGGPGGPFVKGPHSTRALSKIYLGGRKKPGRLVFSGGGGGP